MAKIKILTHGGQAHADEVMAIALILYKENLLVEDAEIIRSLEPLRARQFVEKYAADFVVDVGGDSDPRKNWFDHHQFPREAGAACAFTLVARKYKVDLTRLLWAEQLAVMDSKGPTEWFRRVVGRLPRDGGEMARAVQNGSSIFDYICGMANNNFLDGVRFAREWLEREILAAEAAERDLARALAMAQVVPLGPGAKMAYFETADARGTLAATERLQKDDPEVLVAGMRDERSDGYSARRLMDNDRVDFLAREGEAGCIFAHKTGFLVKWENNWDGFVDACRRSVK